MGAVEKITADVLLERMPFAYNRRPSLLSAGIHLLLLISMHPLLVYHVESTTGIWIVAVALTAVITMLSEESRATTTRKYNAYVERVMAWLFQENYKYVQLDSDGVSKYTYWQALKHVSKTIKYPYVAIALALVCIVACSCINPFVGAFTLTAFISVYGLFLKMQVDYMRANSPYIIVKALKKLNTCVTTME